MLQSVLISWNLKITNFDPTDEVGPNLMQTSDYDKF